MGIDMSVVQLCSFLNVTQCTCNHNEKEQFDLRKRKNGSQIRYQFYQENIVKVTSD